MNKNIKTLTAVALTMLMLTSVGCGRNTTKDNSMNGNMNGGTTNGTTNGTNNGTGNSTNNGSKNGANSTEAMTKEEYATYLTERYNHYFGDETRYENYNIFGENFDFGDNFNEFMTGYTTFYGEETENLKAFKKDLETNVRKGTPEVDKLNDQVMTALDKAITTSEEYGGSFAERTKDYGTLAKDEVVKGLRDIGRAPYDARVELHKLVTNAKTTLGIK